jgi:protease PrsW
MKILRCGWFQIFVGGLILLFLVEWALATTHNLNYIPSVIVLGAFLVPVTFVSYLYERLQDWGVKLRPVVLCFLWGGVLGTVVAGVLEYQVAVTLGFVPKVGIGVIEELAKLIVPLIFYFLGRYRSEAAGIVLGVASGMGFAAFETMGYAFVSLLQSRGNLVLVDWVLLLRGLLSPAGHAAWTGLVCAVLWRDRLKAGHAVLNWSVAAAFLTAVILHALWDILASNESPTVVEFAVVELLSLLVALISLTLLIRRVREARQVEASNTGRARKRR